MAVLAPLAIPLAIAGATASAGGAIFSGIAQSEASNYQAQVAKNNATTATQNAAYAEKAGEAQTEAAGQKAAAELGQVEAAQSAGGVNINSPSSIATRVGQREGGSLTEQNVAQNANLQAYGYETQATNYTAESQLDTATAENAIPGSLLSATGTVLSTAGTLPGLPAKWAALTGGNTGTGVYDPDTGILGGTLPGAGTTGYTGGVY